MVVVGVEVLTAQREVLASFALLSLLEELDPAQLLLLLRTELPSPVLVRVDRAIQESVGVDLGAGPHHDLLRIVRVR